MFLHNFVVMYLIKNDLLLLVAKQAF